MPWVEFDHRSSGPLAGSWKNSMLNKPCVKPTAAEKRRRHVQRPALAHRPAGPGKLEAHEGLGAGVHHRVDHTHGMNLSVEHPAVEIELRRVRRTGVFQHHAVGAVQAWASVRRASPARTARPGAESPTAHGAEARVRLQLGVVVHRTRQHRERRLHRLDEAREARGRGECPRRIRREAAAWHVGFRRDLLQHLCGRRALCCAVSMASTACPASRMRSASSAAASAPNCSCCEATPLQPSRLEPAAPVRRHEASQVEPDQPRVAWEREQVETGFVQLNAPRRSGTGMADRVPVIVEQRQGSGTRSGGCHEE
jgi:hypothetical protein